MFDLLGAALDRSLLFAAAAWRLAAVAALIATAVRYGSEPAARRVMHRLLRVLRRVPLWLPALVSLAVNVAMFAGRGEPLPEVHDDYSQLLLADTLRMGRLANPPHPFSRHFETMLALQHPAYASHFPPASGVLMAATWIAFGLPILGLWIAGAAAAVAIAWAARAWLPRSWAMLTGLLVACHPTVVIWGTSYAGGFVGFFAGALLAGACARMARRATHAMAAVAAVALVILANSRPFEGFVFAVAIAIALSIFAPRAWPNVLRHSVAALLILTAGAASILIYNRAVTGNALLLPHALYDRTYTPAPNFVWEPQKPPVVFPNEEMAMAFRSVYLAHDRLRRMPGGELRALRAKFDVARWTLFPRTSGNSAVGLASLLLYIPLLTAPHMLRRKRNRALVLVLAIFLIAPLITAWWTSAHYLSPAGVIVATLYMLCFREMFVRWRAAGGTLALAMLVMMLWLSGEAIVAETMRPQNPIEVQRRAIAAELQRLPGKDLILVPAGISGCVFNAADIDHAPVVWARELDAKTNAALVRYFGERRVWRLEPAGARLRVRSESRVPPRPRPLP
ncbi:MAG: hypothetical protein M3Q69_05550 [Acidobacteriota bacterium]|nr:hypothetical protein [Acidobacteriota bacterium]